MRPGRYRPIVRLGSWLRGGIVTVELDVSVDLTPGWRLAFTSVAPLTPHDPSATELVEQLGTYHVVAPASPTSVCPGGRWTAQLTPGHELRHANDGPRSAYVITAAGDVIDADVEPTVSPERTAEAAPSALAVVPSGDQFDPPTFAWRGLHVDLARQWFEPDTVEWLIDVAAERGLNRLHLHLTDDEGWRLPVEDYPALAHAAVRGHGLVLPPMLGGGAQPEGRLYTAGEIARWVAHAGAAGVVLVPEVDMPAHMHAALAALPELRDPDDRTGARSIQGFLDNVLVPGHPETDPFVDAVLDALCALFPASPWIHIGGDEVAPGAWARSPIAARFAAARGAAGANAIAAAFMRDIADRVRQRGRQVVAWQEIAEAGGLDPDDGNVLCWQSVGVARVLAAKGFDVVVAPGSAYYFDMAADDRWESPGSSWAGSVSVERVADFEPGRGWSEQALAHLVGVQACLWTEHVRDRASIERMLLPRLDAFARRAWTGRRPALVDL